jgi:hypothetical protein
MGFNLAQYATTQSAQPNQVIEDSAVQTAAVDLVEFVTITPVRLRFEPQSLTITNSEFSIAIRQIDPRRTSRPAEQLQSSSSSAS